MIPSNDKAAIQINQKIYNLYFWQVQKGVTFLLKNLIWPGTTHPPLWEVVMSLKTPKKDFLIENCKSQPNFDSKIKRRDPKKITSDIGFKGIKSCVWIKLSQKNKRFAKISSLARVMAEKPSKNYFWSKLLFLTFFWPLLRLQLKFLQTVFFPGLVLNIHNFWYPQIQYMKKLFFLPSKDSPYGFWNQNWAGTFKKFYKKIFFWCF